MNKLTLALLCGSALLTACDSSNNTNGEASLLDKASSLATDAANTAKESAESGLESAKDVTNNAIDSAKEAGSDAMDADRKSTR